LSPDFAACATGTQQSPIDIPSSAPTNPADLQLRYQPSDLTIANTGHSLQANYDPGSFLQVDDQTYELLQFHFHNPGGHTVDGNAPPMNVHLVHEDSQGGLAVVELFIIEGEENTALAPFFNNLPAAEGEVAPSATVNAAEILPDDQSYWRYNGSLTTPPCTEGVKWFVMTTPVELSADQIAAHNAIYSGNARPTEPMNDRDFIVGQVPAAQPTSGGVGLDGQLTVVIVVAGTLLVLGAAAGYSAHRRRLHR
jgi:carbonic anhydrase